MNFKKYLPILLIYLAVFIPVFSIIMTNDNQGLYNDQNSLVVTAVVSTPMGKNLIPVTAIPGENDVTEVELTYNVKMVNSVLDLDDLYIQTLNVTIGDEKTYSNLVNISIEKKITNFKNELLVIVTVSLNEPEDKFVYEAIKNQPIQFDLRFSSINFIEI